MVNKNLLMGKIVEAGYSQRRFAIAIGMNPNTFNLKINNAMLKNGNRAEFKSGEMEAVCAKLNITDPAQKAEIFLYHPSQKCNELRGAI